MEVITLEWRKIEESYSRCTKEEIRRIILIKARNIHFNHKKFLQSLEQLCGWNLVSKQTFIKIPVTNIFEIVSLKIVVDGNFTFPLAIGIGYFVVFINFKKLLFLIFQKTQII